MPLKRLRHHVPAGPTTNVVQLNADSLGTDGRTYDLLHVLKLPRESGCDEATIDVWPVDQPPPLPAAEWAGTRSDERLMIAEGPSRNASVIRR